MKYGYGKMLYLIRAAKNLSQDELAEKAKISKSSISRYETGTRLLTFSKFEKICSKLSIPQSLTELMAGEKVLSNNEILAQKIGLILLEEVENSLKNTQYGKQ